MALQNITSDIRNIAQEVYQKFHSKKERSQITKYVSIVVVSILSLVMIFFAYRWYIVYREESVQKVFGQYLKEYSKALQTNSVDDWDQVNVKFKLGYDKNSGTYLGPYFLAFQSEALLRLGKKQEALDVMTTLVDKLSSSSPFLPLFSVKRALLLLDSESQDKQEEGVKVLQKLIGDSSNKFYDLAAYHLGQYYWAHDKAKEAQEVWQRLVDSQRAETIAQSPWSQLAQQKLEQS